MTQPHLSLNGTSGTLWEIRRQENIHPYLGIRQAILIINDHTKALKEGKLAQKKARVALSAQKEKFLSVEGDERDILFDEIELAEYNLESFDQLILDVETELNVALQEKLRIENCNPDMITKSYEELQVTYANEAFQCKLARAVVVSAYSSHKMISEGAAEVIYDSGCLPKIERERFELNVISQLRQLLPPEPINPVTLQSTAGGNNGLSIN
jgi:hypothetical protein